MYGPNPYGDGTQSELIWDLRQTYAEIISQILRNIADARGSEEFNNWFNLMDDQLYVEVNQKLTPKEREDYKKVKNTTLSVLNKFPIAYKNNQAKGNERYEIKQALKIMEMWLRDMMEKHKMFGSKEEVNLD